MTSKLSDAEVGAQLREMGQDIGPMNDATRGVYRRKLERLLLEQSILSSSSAMESPPKESQQMKAPEKEATQSLRPSVNAAEEFEDDLELDEICEGSLRLEDDESEDDFLDEHRIRRCESGRSEFGLKGVRPMNDVSSARERRFPESDDIFAAGRNLFVPVPRDDEGGRKESVDDRYKLSGSFSSAPLATPDGSRNRSANAETSHLRQRTAVPPGQEMTNDVGSYDRVVLKPEDYVLSPRNPLSTYLERCPLPPSGAPQLTRSTDRPARVHPTKQKENGRLFWIIVAIVGLICILALLVLYNMEPGYESPV